MKSVCREVEPLIDELVDKTLDEARERAVRGHLRECAGCAKRAQATRELLDGARSLERLDPPPELWEKVVARLDKDEIAFSHRSPLWWWWHAWQRRVLLGGATLAIAAAVAIFVQSRRHEGETSALARAHVVADPEQLYLDAVNDVARAGDEYTRAIDELGDLVKTERGHWRPEVARAFDENLATIEAAIARQGEIARAHPGDPHAADALASSYRKEIDFLQEAVVRGEAEGETR